MGRNKTKVENDKNGCVRDFVFEKIYEIYVNFTNSRLDKKEQSTRDRRRCKDKLKMNNTILWLKCSFPKFK